MAYYDRLVDNPDEALKYIAARRNLSSEELLARIGDVYAEARSGKHLSLGEAMRWLEAPEGASRELRSHIDSCRYCQALLDGLAPARLSENVGRLQRETTGRRDPFGFFSELFGRASEWVRSYGAPVGAALALGFAVALVVVPNSLNSRALFGWTEDSLSPAILTAAATSTSVRGVVRASCNFVRTSGDSSVVLCFKPKSAADLHVKLASDSGGGRWVLTRALASPQAHGVSSTAAEFKQPFFAHDALKPGDEVLVFKPRGPQSGDSAKAVADSLAALKASVSSHARSDGSISTSK